MRLLLRAFFAVVGSATVRIHRGYEVGELTPARYQVLRVLSFDDLDAWTQQSIDRYRTRPRQPVRRFRKRVAQVPWERSVQLGAYDLQTMDTLEQFRMLAPPNEAITAGAVVVETEPLGWRTLMFFSGGDGVLPPDIQLRLSKGLELADLR